MSHFLTKNPISGLEVIVSRDNQNLLPKLSTRKLDEKCFRDIKKNKTKIIKEKLRTETEHSIRSWIPS